MSKPFCDYFVKKYDKIVQNLKLTLRFQSSRGRI